MYNDAIRMGSREGAHQYQEARHRLTMASKVFDDPNVALIKDRIADESGEQRWHAIGAASIDKEAALLVVVHVYRGQNEEEIVRISAREASKRERRLYIQ